jgi:hypoxanthine phosphoribosyltransferase
MQELDFIKEVLFDEEEVSNRISDIRKKILLNYDGCNKPVKVFSILKGGRYLSKYLFDGISHKKFQTNYISASSYINNKKLPNNKIHINWMGQPFGSFMGERVLIVDDIYDTGNTLWKVRGEFLQAGAKVDTVVLIKRTGHHDFEVPLLSYGFEVTNKDYLVGCGLDYNGGYRGLPYIASVKE